MAQKLPDETSLTQVAAPAASPGVRVPEIDYSPSIAAGRAISGGLSDVSKAIGKFASEANEREDFATRARFIDFKQHQDNAFQAREREGTLSGWDQEYDKNARDFFKTVPEREKAKYDLALTDTNAQFASRVRDATYRQQDAFETDTLKQKANDLLAAAQRDPTQLDSAKSDFNALINASNLPADKKREIQRSANAAFEEAAFKGADWRGNPAGAKAALGLDKSGGGPSTVDRIIGVESGGDPNARSSTSSATGAGQFIDSTWLAMVNKYRPELMAGKSRADILALRTDPVLSREMTAHYANENADKLKARGIPVNDANTYLAHFLGPAGAIGLLSVSRDTPVSAVLGRDQIEANKSVLAGKTVGEVQDWAARRMGSQGGSAPYTGDPRFANIPYERRLALAADAEQNAIKADAADAAATTAAYQENLKTLQTNIIDGKAGASDVQDARSQGWLTDAGTISQLNGMIARRDKENADTVNFSKAFADPGFAWNPIDKTNQDWVDAGYKALAKEQGPLVALQTVASRTGIVPESAGVALRGSLISPDPKVVQGALAVVTTLVGGKYPDIFAGTTGGDELSKAGVFARHYLYDRGMSPEEVTKRYMEEQTPEYQQKIKARIKSEDVNAIVKKELKDSDIRGSFDDSWIPFNDPKLTFDPASRQRAMGDYEEAFRENFAGNGDVALSKKQALEDMRRTWGTTEISGQKTVMKYPPERSPVYAGIENVSEQIALQAVVGIKDWNGVDIDRSKLRLNEVRGTAESYASGRPPVYALSYVDKNGHVQTIPKLFYADPAKMKDEQTANRAAESAKIRTRVDIDADMADLNRANFGVSP